MIFNFRYILQGIHALFKLSLWWLYHTSSGWFRGGKDDVYVDFWRCDECHVL